MKIGEKKMANVPAKGIYKDTLVIVNSFVHDMTTGMWIGSLIMMRAILLKFNGLQSDLLQQLANSLFKDLWTLSLVSFTVMVLSGAGRVFTLKTYGWTGSFP